MFTVLCRHAHSDWQSTAAFLYVIGKYITNVLWTHENVLLFLIFKKNIILNFVTIHLNEFLIGHYIKYDIMQNISSMHLKFGNFVLYTPLYRLTERKNVSMYKTVHAER